MLVLVISFARSFTVSRASDSSIYLVRMASLSSMESWGGVTCVSGSFPLLVGYALGVGLVMSMPLDVGCSVSSVMG